MFLRHPPERDITTCKLPLHIVVDEHVESSEEDRLGV